MSNVFNCCVQDQKGSLEKLKPMEKEQLNGYSVAVPKSCPFVSEGKAEGQRGSKPNLRIRVPQPLKLKNHLAQDENYDLLHSHVDEISSYTTKCSEKVCQSSVMDIPGRGSVLRTPDEVYSDAQILLQQYFASIRRENSEAHVRRLKEVRDELTETGTYKLKTAELVFGAKLAWRNAARCIGRIQWKKLQLFDCREVTTATGMFEALCTHIKYATNKGNIRSAITIFPPRTDGQHDYRIWNPQLITYAGYRQPDGSVLGDPARVEFTDICIQLGWKPKYTAWDILPLVLSADGKDPEFFEIPRDIVMEVHLEHPEFDWFKELQLRWYALPAVSSMRFDCGGLEFTANAFNGWYMSTEIGCRNLCDSNRFNTIETVAMKMGLDTKSYTSLWKDKALVEVNLAVLHSFHRDNATIVDHHTASEQFIKHLDNENKSRGGCPADWIWIVPPMSSSLTPVFHQEMALYYFRPSYDYQEPAWKTHQWKKPAKSEGKRKFHFKQIARAVKFTSRLFGHALSKRIKATILYATETGKSEQYAKELGNIFGHVFNAQVHCMSEYDMFSIEHETLLLVVTSTFGNGEPPANGVEFADHLFQMFYHEQQYQGHQVTDFSAGSMKLKTPTPKSLMRANSIMTPVTEFKKPLSRLESLKSSVATSSIDGHIGPLSNVCFAVFGLGSSAYPKFCNFAKTVDKILGDLGGERLLEIGVGDELSGQEQQFHLWASNIFQVSCETFCLEDNDMVKNAKSVFGSMPLTEETVRFGKVTEAVPMKSALETGFRRQLVSCTVKENKNLGHCCSERATIFVDLEPIEHIKYDPGDHVGIMACNRKEIVDAVLAKLTDVDDYDKPVQLQNMKETLTVTGAFKNWHRHERISAMTVRDIYTRFLDITTPPSISVLKYLASKCSNENEANELKKLVAVTEEYDDWRHFHYPNLAEVLEMFPSCKPKGSLLAAILPPLQPRFYSISSSLLAHPNRVHLTVAVVRYNTRDGEGPEHYGVCSTFLQTRKPGDEVFAFIRRAPSFHMPKDITAPIILVGPGTGVAPFRGFWHHRRELLKEDQANPGAMWLIFGCRNQGLNLYEEEKAEALKNGVLTKSMVALSREDGVEKKYVQNILEEEGPAVCRMLLEEGGHFYVCGDCKMAEDVMHKLKGIMKAHAGMTDEEVGNCILGLMDDNRYHEDIFGITLRTAEVHRDSRDLAKRTRLESMQSQH
ncbi:unnamed protein product [Plutella xylostella]|uniref:Nitric oxide synthase n=1 Tax=Plutella xylostella TaxID=51655 RepID=A0A8S4D754_PLUXY|nr:unnamed protein product [Plutella xylostella]